MATPLAVAGIISLAAAMVFGRRPSAGVDAKLAGSKEDQAVSFVEIPMPPANGPLMALLGLGLILWSWPFIATAAHIPAATAVDAARAALNGVLSALTAGLIAAFYSRFATAGFNPLMALRGAVAGLVAVSTVAPFIPPWQGIVIGAVAGLLTPLLIYLVDQTFNLQDPTASIASFAFMGIIAWLLPGLLADGSGGAGWNNVGIGTYLNVEGQGISGLLVAGGYAPDWPGQLQAQLLGAATVFGYAFLIAFVYFRLYRAFTGRKALRSSFSEVSSAESQPVQQVVGALIPAAAADGQTIPVEGPLISDRSVKNNVVDNGSVDSDGDTVESELEQTGPDAGDG